MVIRSRLGTYRLAAAVVIAALAGGVSAGAAASRPVTAHAAGTLTLSDTARLHLTSHHSFTLNEQGSASGTVNGTIYIHLRIVSTNRVSAEVNIYPSGGSITGYASAHHPSEGSSAGFSGSMSVARGTGHYNHAHGSGLSFSGSIRRSDDAVTVYLRGRMYD